MKEKFQIICPNDETHVITQVFDVAPGTRGKAKTTVDVYCPKCDDYIRGTVDGELQSDTTGFRGA